MRVLTVVRLVAVLYGATATSLALAADFPSFPGVGYLSNHTGDRHGLFYECRLVDGRAPAIACDFTRLLVSYEANPGELDLQMRMVTQDTAKPGLRKTVVEILSQCEDLDSNPQYIEARDIDRDSGAGPAKRAAAKGFLRFIENLCSTKDRDQGVEELIDAIRLMLELQTKTCKVWTNIWEQTFEYQPGAGNWVAQSGPEGDCGITLESTFTPDPERALLWNLETAKIVTHKEGKALDLLACSTFEDRTDLYVWNSHGKDINCEVVTFGP